MVLPGPWAMAIEVALHLALLSFGAGLLARKLGAATHAAETGEDLGSVAKRLKLWGASRDPIMRLALSGGTGG